jgi:ppGpp synthetase/RelA/SpoT-type nucleotidyltranferase
VKNNYALLNSEEKKIIKPIVERFKGDLGLVEAMLSSLVVNVQRARSLSPHVHSIRFRVKDPTHLQDKLARKLLKARAGEGFSITPDNLFEKINDLAGLRILHLHSRQIGAINAALNDVFAEYRYSVIEAATARTWDDEYRRFYESLGIATKDSEKMYTSVHYVIESNSATKLTCEIQVRTLAEELWGEVDHSMNYPNESNVEACREQIRVLARLTSGCSRLVDSIYSSSNKK